MFSIPMDFRKSTLMIVVTIADPNKGILLVQDGVAFELCSLEVIQIVIVPARLLSTSSGK